MGFVIVDAPRSAKQRARYWRHVGGWGLIKDGWATVWPSMDDATREVAEQKIAYANIKIEKSN